MPLLFFIFLCFFTSLPRSPLFFFNFFLKFYFIFKLYNIVAHFYLVAQLKNMQCCPFAHRMRCQLLSLPFQLYYYFVVLLFISGCARSSLLCKGFLSCGEPGLLCSSGVHASHCCGLLQRSGSGVRAQ